MTCRNPVLQTWQISVTAKQEPALRCEYTVAAMLFSGPESPRYVLDGKVGQAPREHVQKASLRVPVGREEVQVYHIFRTEASNKPTMEVMLPFEASYHFHRTTLKFVIFILAAIVTSSRMEKVIGRLA
jgi:hypothetical protein